MNDDNLTRQVSLAIINTLRENNVTELKDAVTCSINGCATCLINALKLLGCDEPEAEVADYFRQAADQLEGGADE